MYESIVLKDSVAPNGRRLVTLQTTLPRMVLSEFNTHRDFSRNSASSRAIPVKKNIKKVSEDPFIPEGFMKNQKGMQEGVALNEEESDLAKRAWMSLHKVAIATAEILAELEVHKHWANRPLELFNGQTIIVTASRWDNFYALRRHPDAAPEMRYAADSMLSAMEASTPEKLKEGGWHLPLVTEQERSPTGEWLPIDMLVELSCARCARVSALTHDGTRDLDADITLYNRLASRGHMSPLEHAAKVANEQEIMKYAMWKCRNPEIYGTENPVYHFDPVSIGNLDVPWLQHRKMIPGESVFHG